MSGSRQRLRPWLVNKINSEEIPGLYWLDKERKIFRIPWKHGGKQDWAPEHSQIFMEWALHTGKFRKGLDNPEWAKWKTRLRCAFNKAPDILELKDKSDPEAADPFKVYQFKDNERQPRASSTTSRHAHTVQTKSRTTMHGAQVAPQLPLVVENACVSSSSGDLPSDLRGIPSLELMRAEDPEVTVNMSTGSLPSFGDVKTEHDMMDTSEHVAVDPVPFATNEATGAPMFEATFTTTPGQPGSGASATPSPLLGTTPVCYRYAQPGALSSPAASDATFELSASPAASPAASDVSSAVSTLGGPAYLQQPSPLQGDLPGLQPVPMTPVEVNVSQESLELNDHLLELTVLQELPSHLALPPGPLTLHLVEGRDGESQMVLKSDPAIPGPIQGHELLVRVQYLNVIVLEERITEQQGCRIYYGSDADIRSVTTIEQARKIHGPIEASQLHLPPCVNNSLTPKHEEYTMMLLESLNRGVYIDCVDGDIYATRFCKCVVYHCNQQHQEGTKLIRHQRTKIFDFTKDFLPAYQHYQCNRQGQEPPSPEVCLSFGQKSFYTNMAQTTLISAYVVNYKALQMLDEVARQSDPLGDMEMQISEPDEDDHKLELYKLVEPFDP